jgi:hypothetical protein
VFGDFGSCARKLRQIASRQSQVCIRGQFPGDHETKATRPSGVKLRHVIEFRHPSWHRE